MLNEVWELYVITYMWNKKKKEWEKQNRYREQRLQRTKIQRTETHRYREQSNGYQWGKGWRRGKMGVRD